MATNERRRIRYAEDDSYRQARIMAALAYKRKKQLEKERERRLREWRTIDTAPDNEVIMLYDPAVFWPVVGSWDGKQWNCVHFEGLLKPTHWRPVLPIPLI